MERIGADERSEEPLNAVPAAVIRPIRRIRHHPDIPRHRSRSRAAVGKKGASGVVAARRPPAEERSALIAVRHSALIRVRNGQLETQLL
jgi:hypothetical protein